MLLFNDFCGLQISTDQLTTNQAAASSFGGAGAGASSAGGAGGSSFAAGAAGPA